MYKLPMNQIDNNIPRKSAPSRIELEIQQDPEEQMFSATQQDLNDNFCFKCKEMGELFCCDNCNRTYHNTKNCMNQEYIPQITQDSWRCQCCQTRQICSICNELLDESMNPFVCTICQRFIHKSCYSIPEQILNQSHLKNPILKQPNQILCSQCIKTSGINKFLSFTQLNNRIFHQIVPHFVSNIHRGWIDQLQLLNFSKKSQSKIKLDDLLKKKQYINVDSDSKIQKILALKAKLYWRSIGMEKWLDLLEDDSRRTTFGNSNNFRFLIKWQNIQSQFSTWQDQYVARSNIYEFKRFIIKKRIEECKREEPSQKKEEKIKDQRDKLQQLKDIQYKNKKNQYEIDDIKAKFENKRNIAIQLQKDSQYRQICLLRFLNYFIRRIQSKNTSVIIMTNFTKLSNWEKLLKKQCFMLDFVIYNGNRANRNYIRQHQFYIHKPKQVKQLKFNIILTTFEIFQADYEILSNKSIFNWECMIFDDDAKYQSFQQMFLNCYSKIQKILLFNNVIKGNYYLYQKLFNMDIKGKKLEELTQIFQNNHLVKFKDDYVVDNKKKFNITNQNIQIPSQQPIQIPSQQPIQMQPVYQMQQIKNPFTKLNQQKTIVQQILQTPKLDIQQQKIIQEQAIQQNKSQIAVINKKILVDNQQNLITIQQDEIQELINQKQIQNNVKQNTQIVKYQKLQSKLQKIASQYMVNQNCEQIWKEIKRIKFLRFIIMFGIDFKQPQLMFNRLLLFSDDVFVTGKQQFNKFKTYTSYFLSFLRFQLDDCQKIKQYYYFDVDPKCILRRILSLSNLNKMYKKYKDKVNEFPPLEKFVLFKNKKLEKLFAYSWTAYDDLELIRLILLQGFGNWKSITEKFEDFSTNKRKKGVQILKQKLANNTEMEKRLQKESYFLDLFNERATYLMEYLCKRKKPQNSH